MSPNALSKVLVTGGAGYIGSHTTRALQEAGYQVVILDNLSTGFKEAVPPSAELVVGDIRDTKLVTNLIRDHKIDSVIHFAAKTVVPESIEKPNEYYDNNTAGVLSLLEACRQTNVKKFVFSSTAAVYGETTSPALSEDVDLRPANPYGMSKYMSECIIRDAGAYGLRSVILRYFNVAGASSDGTNGQRSKNATHLIKVVCEAALGIRPTVSIFGTDYPTKDGTAVRDYIHIEDISDLHVIALKYLEDGGSSETFNCGYGHGRSVKEVIQVMDEINNSPVPTTLAARRPGDVAISIADNTKVKKVFKWKPRFDDLKTICASAYEWEKKIKR